MTTADEFLSRACNMYGQPLWWAVCGSHADDSGGGVLAWCWDEEDADRALDALTKTGRFTGLAVEYLGGAS